MVQAQVQEWDAAELLHAVVDPQKPAPLYAVLLINTPIPPQLRQAFERLWQNATLRICADGAGNRLYDEFGEDCLPRLKLPDWIVGDLDSIRPEVCAYFQKRGSELKKRPSQYATDLQKSIQAIEDAEAAGKIPHLQLVLFGGLTGRLDHTAHTLHVMWQLAPDVPMDNVIAEPPEPGSTSPPRGSALAKRERTLVVSDQCVAWVLPKGEHILYHDRTYLGKTCSLLPFGSGRDELHVHTEGLEWNLHGEAPFMGGFMPTSNHLAPDNPKGTVRVITDGPVYWTVELQSDEVRQKNMTQT